MTFRQVRIKQFGFICIFVFMLFFRPASYIIGSRIHSLLNYTVFAVSIILLFSSLYFVKYGYRLNICIKLIFLLYFWCLLGSSLLNSLRGNPIDYSEALVSYANMLAFVLICDIGLWYSPKKLIKCFLIVGIIICSINAITMFLYYKSGGMYHELTLRNRINNNYYFLGEDNASYFWIWPVLVVCWIYYYVFNSRRRFLFIAIPYTFLVTCSYIYTRSVLAAIACVSVPFCLFILLKQLKREKEKKKNNKGLRFSVLWKIALIFDAVIPSSVMLSYIVPIAQQLFHKSATLSYRTYIWEKSISYIAKSPFIGYGYEPTLTSVSKLLVNHTHNLVLETFYRGGIIGLVLFVVVFIVLTKKTECLSRFAIYKFITLMLFLFLLFSSIYFAFYRYHYLILIIILTHTELFDNKNEDSLNLI